MGLLPSKHCHLAHHIANMNSISDDLLPVDALEFG
jgi:hypothetical protein